jgi:hypothetical protein
MGTNIYAEWAMFGLKHRFFESLRAFSSSVALLRFLLPLIVLIVSIAPTNIAHALDLSFAWDAITEPDLAGYRLFHRQGGQHYDYNNRAWEGTETTCTIYGLDDNTTYYFVARAYNDYGDESENSNEVRYEPEIIEDRDGDGVLDYQDAFPDDPDEWADTDGDGEGDNADVCPNDSGNDVDGDGLCADVDNCPETYNAGQRDSDGDGIGNKCDAYPYDHLR